MKEVSYFSSVLSSLFVLIFQFLCILLFVYKLFLVLFIFLRSCSIFYPPSLPARFSSSVMTSTTVHSGPAFQIVLGFLVERQQTYDLCNFVATDCV